MNPRLSMLQWLIATSLAALVGWFAVPLDAQPLPLVQPRRDDWLLRPLPVVSDATARAAMVATAAVWGVESKTVDTAVRVENTRWRLAGVFGEGKSGGALILFEDLSRAPQKLKVGEALPSGHRIEAIEGNLVCVRIGSKLYKFGVEARE